MAQFGREVVRGNVNGQPWERLPVDLTKRGWMARPGGYRRRTRLRYRMDVEG